MSTNTDSRKKKPSKLVLLLVVIALASCGFAGYAFWKIRQTPSQPQIGLAAVSSQSPATIAQPLFFPLEPFTVNLVDKESQDERVLYVGFTLRVTDANTEVRLREYLPEVRSRLLLLLSHQQQTALQTEEGKSELTAQIRNTLKSPFAQGLPEQNIADVLFTTFILR